MDLKYTFIVTHAGSMTHPSWTLKYTFILPHMQDQWHMHHGLTSYKRFMKMELCNMVIHKALITAYILDCLVILSWQPACIHQSAWFSSLPLPQEDQSNLTVLKCWLSKSPASYLIVGLQVVNPNGKRYISTIYVRITWKHISCRNLNVSLLGRVVRIPWGGQGRF